MDHFKITEDYFTQENHELLIKSEVIFQLFFMVSYVMKFAQRQR